MFRLLKSPIRTGFLVIWSLFRQPKYCFAGLAALVWRSTVDTSCEILLRDDPCDLKPEALDKASSITVLDFCPFKALFNLECDSSSSSSLPVFMKEPSTISYNTLLMPVVPPRLSYSYDIITFWLGVELQLLLSVSPAAHTDMCTLGRWCSSSHLGRQLRNISICAVPIQNTGQSTETLIKILSQGQK